MPRMPARPHGAGKKEARAFEARGKWQPTYQRAGQWGHGPTIQVLCKQHHPAVEPSPDHHTHPQQLHLGSCFSRGDKPSCGASVLHRVLSRWCHPGLLVHLALSWLQVGSCPVTHMDGRQVRPNVGVFHQISVCTSQSGNLVCHRALFHGQGLGSTETRCSPHLFSPILDSASTYSTCSHCIRLQGAALDLALRGVWSLHLGKDDHRSNNISTMKQTRYLHPAAGT